MFDHIGGWRGLLGCALGCLVLIGTVAAFRLSEALGWVVLVAVMWRSWRYTGW